VFGRPKVDQDPSPHDLVADMKSKYLGYEQSLRLVEAIHRDSDAITAFLPERAVAAFDRYRSHFDGSGPDS